MKNARFEDLTDSKSVSIKSNTVKRNFKTRAFLH